MKASTFGIGFIILGIMMVAYTGVDFITKKRVVDIGPIKIDKEVKSPDSMVTNSWCCLNCWRD